LNRFFAFKLSHASPIDFSLIPQNSLTKIEEGLTNKDISTESNDFNKKFHINYIGDRGLAGEDIFQVLSPEIQEKLIDFHELHTGFTMLFRGPAVFVSYKGDLNISYTNFFRRVTLDERDADMIQSTIMSCIEVAEEILPLLDKI